MTRLLVREAEFDGAVRMAVNAGMDPARARAAARLLYVLPSSGGDRTPPATSLAAGPGGAGAPVGRPSLDSRPAAPSERTQR